MVGANIEQLQEEEEVKKLFTDAIHHCMDLLHANNHFTDTRNDQLSPRSKIFGKKMFEYMQSAKINLINQRKDGPSIRSSSLDKEKSCQKSPGNKNLNGKNLQRASLFDCFVYVRPEERLVADSVVKGSSKSSDSESMIPNEEEPQESLEQDVVDDDEELPRRKSMRQSAPISSSSSSSHSYAEEASDDEFDCDDDYDEDYFENDKDKNSSDEMEDSTEENHENSSEDNDDNNDDDDSEDDEADKTAEPPKKQRKITKSKLPVKNRNNNSESNEEVEEILKSRHRNKSVPIPYETKLLVLKLERENPDWEIKTLRKRSRCKQVDSRHQLRQWADYVKRVESGKPKKDKSEVKKKEFIPYEMKVKVVNLMREHPDWPMKVLQERSGCPSIGGRKQIRLWAKHVKSGGSLRDKNKKIYTWIYKKCLEYKEQKKKIDNKMLFEWSYEGQKVLFPDDPVKKIRPHNRQTFLNIFKDLYKITGHSPDLKIPDEKTGENPDHSESDSDSSTGGNSVNNSTAKRKRSRTAQKSMPLKEVPYEQRVKIVNLAVKNPTWSVKQINSAMGSNYAHNKTQIRVWAKALKSGGSVRDKIHAHNRWIYEKCLEYKRLNKKISNEVLLNWSAEAHKVESMRYNPRPGFQGSEKWLPVFKKEYNILGRSPNLEIGERRKNSDDNNADVGESSGTGVVVDNSGSNEDDDGVEDENNTVDCTSIEEYLKQRRTVFISYEKKKKFLDLYRKNPTWTFEELKQHSGVKKMNSVKLNRWIRHIKENGSQRDKVNIINRLVYEKCLEYKKNNKFMNNDLLHKWAIEAKNKYLPDRLGKFIFNASLSWLRFFKETHGITGQSPQLVVSDLPVDKNSDDDSDSDDEEESSDDENVSIESMRQKKPTNKRLPLDKMIKIVNLAHKNPKWTLKELRDNSGCKQLKHFGQLQRWERIITKSNTFIDRCESMNKWIYDQCTEYKKKNYRITDKIIVGWALEAKRIFDNLGTKNFATLLWLNNFKVKYKISGESSDLSLHD